jgi:menaquinone-9 beta-reductase
VLETDVLIVGAGPAGTAAAITLARAGRRVMIIDKATFPRDKCCGDGLTTGALRILDDLGLDRATVPSWTEVDAAWVRSPSGREVRFPMPTGRGMFAAIARRTDLDASMVDLARANGVTIHEGTAFTSLAATLDGEAVDVQAAGIGTIRTRYVIAADGMWSPVRKSLGLNEPDYLGEWHAFRQYYSNVTGPAAKRLYVWFEPDLLPGYAWSFPLPGGGANLGFGVLRDGKRRIQDMKATWADLPNRPHIAAALGPDAIANDRHLAWPIPARVDAVTLTHDRVFFVGDAARVTDPLTGEGIGQALLTGVLAAEAITGAGGFAAPVARRRYEREVRRHLLTDHRMSKFLGRALKYRWGARGSVRVAGMTRWTRENFARWLFEDEPRAIALTPRRWHRRFLDRDGAFVPLSDRYESEAATMLVDEARSTAPRR